MTTEKEHLEQIEIAKRTLRNYLKTHEETCTKEYLSKRAREKGVAYAYFKGYAEGVQFGYRQALGVLGEEETS